MGINDHILVTVPLEFPLKLDTKITSTSHIGTHMQKHSNILVHSFLITSVKLYCFNYYFLHSKKIPFDTLIK